MIMSIPRSAPPYNSGCSQYRA